LKHDHPGFFSRLLGHTFLILNIGTIVWLGICAFVPYTSPTEVRNIALFGLTIPFAILANLFFVVFWLFTRKKLRFLLSLLALGICYKLVFTVFAFNFGKNDMARLPGRVKIMSWNAHGMGIFKKPHDKAFDKRILDFLAEENADIMSLPEYSCPKTDMMKPYARQIIKAGNYKDFRFRYDNTLGTTIFLGTAVFCKYPFRNYVAYKLSAITYLLQGDVELPDGRMLRMFFLHLSSFGLSDQDKAYIEEVKKNNSSLQTDKAKSRTFIWKFNHAYAMRAAEADKAAGIIAQSPYPVVICGDFNDLPASYTYTTIRGNLKDAFLEKGKGLGRTYNEISPTLRIDHMFYDPSILKPVGFECNYTPLSDHNPLIVNFEILPKAGN